MFSSRTMKSCLIRTFIFLVTLLVVLSGRQLFLHRHLDDINRVETAHQHRIEVKSLETTPCPSETIVNVKKVSVRKNLSQRKSSKTKLTSSTLSQCKVNSIAANPTYLECRKRLPHVLGIGVLKCGTGALSTFIKMHPNMVHSAPKELYYWNKYQNESLNWYRNLMPVSSKYQLTMEYTPSYIFGPDIPFLLQKDLPDTKFIMMIRDPVVRAVSHYVHIKYYSWPNTFQPRPRTPDGQTLCFLNDSFETTVLTPSGEVFVDNAVVENGLYEVHLRRWFDIFPRKQFLVIEEGVFRIDPVSVLHQVEDFLGIPKYFDQNKLYFDKKRGIFCKSVPVIWCPSKEFKGRQHPTVDPEVLRKLKTYYHPFNLRLEKLLNRKFPWT